MLLTLSALPLGFLLGLFYFGSLWITVRHLPTLQRPVPLLISSYLGRLVIAGYGFYLIMGGHWERSLVALIGFILARTFLVRRFRSEPPFQGRLGEGQREY
ncbi:MAG: ATP synthase subunit I [Elainellaceae cyanobacterium]